MDLSEPQRDIHLVNIHSMKSLSGAPWEGINKHGSKRMMPIMAFDCHLVAIFPECPRTRDQNIWQLGTSGNISLVFIGINEILIKI